MPAFVFFILLFCLLPARASSQGQEDSSSGTSTGNPKSAIKNLTATNVPWIRAFQKPPASFNIATASEQDLKANGFSPRPTGGSPDELKSWLERNSKARIVPILHENKNVFHGPAKIRIQPLATTGVSSASSDNWSGYVIRSAKNEFIASGMRIDGTFMEPAPSGGCVSGTGSGHYRTSQWVGIDGWGSNDVLQTGTEMVFNCGADADHYAWIEWYPLPEQIVANLPIRQGDTVGLEVWLESGPPNVTYTLQISTQRANVVLEIKPPPGVSLQGNSIEWIVERPLVAGSYADFATFGFMSWSGVQATSFKVGGGINFYMPTSTALADGLSILNVSMDDGVHKPLSMVGRYSPALDNLYFARGDALTFFSQSRPFANK